jgi:hypothetical protein
LKDISAESVANTFSQQDLFVERIGQENIRFFFEWIPGSGGGSMGVIIMIHINPTVCRWPPPAPLPKEAGLATYRVRGLGETLATLTICPTLEHGHISRGGHGFP